MSLRGAFALDPSVVHLNHGSFGAVPRVVSQAQHRVRERVEANPLRFHRVEMPRLKAQARHVAADFLDVDADDVALVRNVTHAAATVLSTLVNDGHIGAGDAVILARHGYESVSAMVDRLSRRVEAIVEIADFPVDAGPDAVVEAHRRAFERAQARGYRPSLLVIDHVASPTAAVVPVARLAAVAREAGALSLVDAAHVPGQLPARPEATGADFWTGSWHKWGFAPRGTTALWAAPKHRAGLEPLATAAPAETSFPLPFDRTGTDDATGWYCLAEAIAFWNDCGGPAIAERSRAMADEGAAVVAAALPEADGPTPVETAPCMRLVALPAGVASTPGDADALYERLSTRGFEVQVVSYGGRGHLRLSAAVYNEPADYERLAKALPEELRATS